MVDGSQMLAFAGQETRTTIGGAPQLGCTTFRVQYHCGRTTTEVVLRLAQARLPELQTLHWEH